MIEPFVPAGWVADQGDRIVLADVRWYLDGRSGRAAYEAGHLPGAVWIDVDRALAGPPGPSAGRHPLPAPADFARAMAAAGIGDGDTVVAYDDAGGTVAARLVWMLRVLGQPAAVLDGGLPAWPGPLATGTTRRPAARFTPAAWPGRALASIDDAADPDGVVLDAREGARFRGEQEPVDPRAGHIPGARSLPAREQVGPDGRLAPVDVLRGRLAEAGVADASTPVIAYCGSGVTACHTLLLLEHAGRGAGRLYPGSWSQWSHDPERPVAVGP